MSFPTPNSTTIADLFAYANTVTNDWFWNVMTLVIWIISFSFLRKHGTKNALTASLFFTTIIAGVLYAMGSVNGQLIINERILFGLAIGTAAMGAMTWFGGDK